MAKNTRKPAQFVTPGPWESDNSRAHYGKHVIRHNGMIVCTLPEGAEFPHHGTPEGNAAHIVKCVNTHETLASACLNALRYIDAAQALGAFSGPSVDAIRQVLTDALNDAAK